jgi:hypothetical protein
MRSTRRIDALREIVNRSIMTLARFGRSHSMEFGTRSGLASALNGRRQLQCLCRPIGGTPIYRSKPLAAGNPAAGVIRLSGGNAALHNRFPPARHFALSNLHARRELPGSDPEPFRSGGSATRRAT